MLKYVLKRIGLMIMTFFIIMTMCFILVRLLPASVARGPGVDPTVDAQIRESIGLNKPLLQQYWEFLVGLITKFDWGKSVQISRGNSVTSVVLEKLPPTMIVNVYTMIFSVPLGIILGVYSALKKNKWQDHLIGVLVMIFVSVPSYVYAFIVQYLLGFKWGWFPETVKEGTDFLSFSMFVSMILPILSLSFGTIAGFTRYIRDELAEVLTSEFMLLARTKGLTRRQATYRHAFRNALVPILPMFIGEFIGILGGSMVIESIFGIPGIAGVYLQSIQIGKVDYNVFLFISMFYVAIGLVAGLLVDVSYGFVDPRIRIGGRK